MSLTEFTETTSLRTVTEHFVPRGPVYKCENETAKFSVLKLHRGHGDCFDIYQLLIIVVAAEVASVIQTVVDVGLILVRERSALADPYCQST